MRIVQTSVRDILPLLRADPHNWGQGLVHLIDAERDQTMCGKSPGGCPGTKFLGTTEKITCRSCLRSINARAQAEERRKVAMVEWQRMERDREERNRLWQARYSAYLLTPVWWAKRAHVLRRAAGRCEGCGDERATQVHHRRYPQGVLPGSPEWIAQEKLFNLVAICRDCHEHVHQRSHQ